MSRIDTHHHHPPGQQPLGRVTVIGLGLIGGSLGQVLCALGASEQVTGWDSEPATLASALQHHAIHRSAGNITDAVADADLVVICVPINCVTPVLLEVASAVGDSTVVTDVSSAKERIVVAGEAIIGPRFVGGHPMAGSEESGFSASSVDLFDAAVWILTPTSRTDPEAVDLVSRMADWSGATSRLCSPEEHDKYVGYLSHLPHIAAFGLAAAAKSGVPDEWKDIAAGSFKGGTRVALSDPTQWAEIIRDNRHSAIAALSQYRSWLDETMESLESDNATSLASLLQTGHSARKQFPR